MHLLIFKLKLVMSIWYYNRTKGRVNMSINIGIEGSKIEHAYIPLLIF